MTLDYGTGGFDIEFDMPTIPDGSSIKVISDIDILYAYPGGGNRIEFSMASGLLSINLYCHDEDGLIEGFLYGSGTYSRARVFFHNNFCSVYLDGNHAHMFGFPYVNHPDLPNVRMASGGTNLTVSNVRLKELSDWREAIFVDMETNTMNAIRSLILQRPVDIYSHHDGSIVFEYDPDRDTVTISFVHDHDKDYKDTSDSCSDAIVYYSDVGVRIDNTFAKDVGFVTRMLRLADMDNGAVRAADVIQKRGRQRRVSHKLVARLNPEIELGDIALISETLTGKGETYEESFIVENLSLQFRNGEQQMVLTGRDNTI